MFFFVLRIILWLVKFFVIFFIKGNIVVLFLFIKFCLLIFNIFVLGKILIGVFFFVFDKICWLLREFVIRDLFNFESSWLFFIGV